MKRICLFALIAVIAVPGAARALTIDHSCADLAAIPAEWITAAKDNLKVQYDHTSHGEQLTCGLELLESGIYQVAIGDQSLPGEAGALCIRDNADQTPEEYFSQTQALLDANPEINVSMFCWCTQLDTYTEAEVNNYLAQMAALEAANPAVTFVYVTGNAQQEGALGYNRHLRNQQIRAYCAAQGKFLFDFGDLDCWRDGVQHTYEYNGEQIPSEDPAYAPDECGHATYESCQVKGKATWWLMATIAGWNQVQMPALGGWALVGLIGAFTLLLGAASGRR